MRSVAKGTLEMKGFRAFPPEYHNQDPNMCPDGKVVTNGEERLEKWGVCFGRYYELETRHHMSSLGERVMGNLNKEFKWVSTLGGGRERGLRGGGRD